MSPPPDRARAVAAEKSERSNPETLEERALSLAASQIVAPERPRGWTNILRKAQDNVVALRKAYLRLADDNQADQSDAGAGEIFLDNFHLVTAGLARVRRDLPRREYRRLPMLNRGPGHSESRIYALAFWLVLYSDSRLEAREIFAFLNSYQRVTPLMMRELRAWPSVLTLALIENLRRLVDELAQSRARRLAADAFIAQVAARGAAPGTLPESLSHPSAVVQLLHRLREYGSRLSFLRASLDAYLEAAGTTAEAAVRAEHVRQAATQESIASTFASLGLCSHINRPEVFESVSLVEQILQRDPAGIYRRMDFPSRDSVRRAVEELSTSGESEVRTALRAVENARAGVARSSMSDPRAHVGYHLTGRARQQFETQIGYRPGFAGRLRRAARQSPRLVTASALSVAALLLLGAVGAYLRLAQVTIADTTIAWLLLLVPTVESAVTLARVVLARVAPPPRLLRLDLSGGVPDEYRTMVVVPTCLTGVEGVAATIEHLETLALANLDPCIHFAILADLGEARTQVLAEDATIIIALRAGIDSLNRRWRNDRDERFFLCHRERRWDERGQLWTGLNGRPGQLEEFDRLLRGAADTSYVVDGGALAVLPAIRYCITVAPETRLPRDAARQLVGIAAHPMNRPQFDAAGGVVDGYGILQPRVTLNPGGPMAAWSEVLREVQGLHDVDAMNSARATVPPRETTLRKALRAKFSARTAFVVDVEFPRQRSSRVVAPWWETWNSRDDTATAWRSLSLARSPSQRQTMALAIALEDVRRRLWAPAIVSALLFGWSRLEVPPLIWSAICLGAVAVPLLVAAWSAAPWMACRLRSRGTPRRALDDADRTFLLEAARKTWKYFEAYTSTASHGLPLDGVRDAALPTLDERTSPSNVAFGLLATLAAYDLRFIGLDDLVARIDAALTTLERLERYEGHFLQRYDIRTLARRAPALVSTADSGNLAAALLVVKGAFDRIQRDGATALVLASSASLAARCAALVDGMNFQLLYDRERELFATGYRLADAEGPGGREQSWHELLASEARLASFLAIAKGDVPQSHWSRLDRSVTRVRGTPVLLSWGASMSEYLAPRLVMRAYPATLLGDTVTMAVRRQHEYAANHDVAMGISDSLCSVVDRHDTYQAKAFGVPGLGLRRGLGDELVVAPYATALAAMIDPALGAANLQRLGRAGLLGEHGFVDALDYTNRDGHQGRFATHPGLEGDGTIVRGYQTNHQGMILVALANALLDDIMVERFHADPRVRASDLLLWEDASHATYVPEPRPRPRDEPRNVAPSPPPPEPARRYHSADTVFPRTQFLSNGRYVTSLTNAGSGTSVCDGLQVTRWRADATCDADGQFIYLRDVRTGRVWSATARPSRTAPDDYRVELQAHRASFFRQDSDISTTLDVAVSVEDDVEVRRLRIVNGGDRISELEITSYAEIVLASTTDDLGYRPLMDLTLETEYFAGGPALLCRRRSSESGEPERWAFHTLSVEGRVQSAVEWETDRARFLGRGRGVADPIALDGRPLSGTTGVVVAPIVSLRQRVRLAPGAAIGLTFATGIAPDRSTVEALVLKYRAPAAASRTFSLGFTHAAVTRRHLGVSADEVLLFARLASRVFGTDRSLRSGEASRSNHQDRSRLSAHGISGDSSILLVQIGGDDGLALVEDACRAQEYWRTQGLRSDLIVLNERHEANSGELQARLKGVVEGGPWRAWHNKPAGVHLLPGDQLSGADAVLFEAVADAILRGDRGSLRTQLEQSETVPWGRPLAPTSPPRGAATKDTLIPPLTIANGYGAFTHEGRTYTLLLEGSNRPPMPWVNVIANPRFGTIVTEAGSSYTWAGDCRANRLTPSASDPISDPTSEALFIRDDNTGESWSPTPGPMRCAPESRCLVRHAAGLTHFARATHGIEHELDVFVDTADPVKFSLLTLTNRDLTVRTLSLFSYTEWALGPPTERNALHVVTEVDARIGAVFARNAYRFDRKDHTAFSFVSEGVVSLTTERRSFIGRNGDLSQPEAMTYATLHGDIGTWFEPCAALHLRVALQPGESRRVLFLLGEGIDREHAHDLIARHGGVDAALRARARVRASWEATLNAIEVRTPDEAFDNLWNHWLVYQVLGGRMWTRGGFYDALGGYGFREQLQDVVALCFTRPELAREHIVRAAGRQFVEGDVLHVWREPDATGVRSRCSDDLLWLPWAVIEYVAMTADSGLLDERVPFVEGLSLESHQQATYGPTRLSPESGTIFEHCLRAITKGLTVGAHGLPLFGSGDWNEGMNRVGAQGQGESVWLGFFLHAVLTRFAALCEARRELMHAERFRGHARRLEGALALAWDGEWFRRGYYDDGAPLGSAQNEECRIDSTVQAWAVLSGAAPARRALRAMDAVREGLISRPSQTVLLLAPPFDRANPDPGSIKGYPPGVRENGGQQTQAATWVAMALAQLGNGDEAVELLNMLLPTAHTRTLAEVTTYQTEPYAVAGDVYRCPPNDGRGGWTWNTGSAAWIYRAGVENILGLRRHGATFSIDPCIPSTWADYEITWRQPGERYLISVVNPDRQSRGVRRAFLDEAAVDPGAIPMAHDGRPHFVRVVMGAPARASDVEAQQLQPLTGPAAAEQDAAARTQTILIARDAATVDDLTQITRRLESLPKGIRGFLTQTHLVRERAKAIGEAQRELNLATRPEARAKLAQNVVEEIRGFKLAMAPLDQPLATEFRRAANRWLEMAEEQVTLCTTVVERAPTMQVFRAGEPAHRVDDAFVERLPIVHEVEQILTHPTGSRCVLLYGRRRVGKSTVLINLPGAVPSAVRVASITMEDARAFSSLEGLIAVLCGAIASAFEAAAPASSPVDLPGLQQFLDQTDADLAGSGLRLCITIDEYEGLDVKLREGVFPVGLLAVVRRSIETHRRLTWMLAGRHDLFELGGARWGSYLISCRTVTVPLFSRDETRALLSDPLRHSAVWAKDLKNRPQLDASFWGAGGIERIYETTSGWPFFVQLMAQLLVDGANERGASKLTPADYDRAAATALERHSTTLREMVRDDCRLDGEWAYLSAFADRDEQPPPADPDVKHSLLRRLLIVVDGQHCRMHVPLFQQWIRGQM